MDRTRRSTRKGWAPFATALAVLWAWSVPATALPEIYLRAAGGYLDIRGGRYNGVGEFYHGGIGGSGEIGVSLGRNVTLGFEVSIPYRQDPKDDEEAVADVDGSDFSMMLGEFRFRFEPVETIRPYLILGGGQSVYAYDFADTGKVFVSGGRIRKIPNDELKAWTAVAGFGFDAPLKGRLEWGGRLRYIMNRWRSQSMMNIMYAYPQGDGFAADLNLLYRF